MTRLLQFIRYLFSAGQRTARCSALLLQRCCAGLVSFSERARQNDTATASTQPSPPPSFPTVPSLSPAQIAALVEYPPAETLEETQLVRLGPEGRIPASLESMIPTEAGPVLRKISFLVVDDFGVVGQPGRVPLRCQACQRTCFGARTCVACGIVLCTVCACPTDTPDGPVPLCGPCAEKLKMAKDNWAADPPPA